MHHTQALILKKDEWDEADWLVTALTHDFGKIRLRVQGARKHGAKLQGHIEPGSISELSFVAARNGYRLTTAELVQFLPNIRSSWSKLQAMYFVLEAVDNNLLEERDRADEIFETTCSLLAGIGSAGSPSLIQLALAWYQAKFFGFLGFLPSPSSEEAGYCLNLLGLSRLPLAEALDFQGGPEIINRELNWLRRYLHGSVHLPPAVAASDSSI